MNSAERISGRYARDADVLLCGRQIAPAHQRLERHRGDAFVSVVAGGSRAQTVRVDASWEPSRAGSSLDSSGDGRPRPGECIVLLGEAFETQFEPERKVEWDEPG